VRTTLDIEEDLVAALHARHPDLSMTEAIEEAIRTYLGDTAIDRLRARAGSWDLTDVSAEFRRHDRRA
jgi:hypothetical protein